MANNTMPREVSIGTSLLPGGKKAAVAGRVEYDIVSTTKRTNLTITGQWNVPGDYTYSGERIGFSINKLEPKKQEKVRDGLNQAIDLLTNPTIVQPNMEPLPILIMVPPAIIYQLPTVVVLPPPPIFVLPLPVLFVHQVPPGILPLPPTQ